MVTSSSRSIVSKAVKYFLWLFSVSRLESYWPLSGLGIDVYTVCHAAEAVEKVSWELSTVHEAECRLAVICFYALGKDAKQSE